MSIAANGLKERFHGFTVTRLAQLSSALSPLTQKSRELKLPDEVQQARDVWLSAMQSLHVATQNSYKIVALKSLFEDVITASELFLEALKFKSPLETDSAETLTKKVKQEFESLLNEKQINEYLRYIASIDEDFAENGSLPESRTQAKKDIRELRSHLNTIVTAQKQAELLFDQKIQPLRDQYAEAVADYERVKPDLQKRASELDKLLGLAGKKVLAGNYDKHSNAERLAANWLRFGALITMLAAIWPLGASIYLASKSSLSIDEGLLRLAFSIILSVPAAYMARESAKHRQQQYALRQTSLDVGAIDAYIATLPADTQHRIKEVVANQLFTPKSFDHTGKESYPINLQELITKLIDVAAEKKAQSAGKEAKASSAE